MANLINFNRGKSSEMSPFSFGNMLEDFFSDPWFSWHRPELGTFRLDIKEDDSEYVVENAADDGAEAKLDAGELIIKIPKKDAGKSKQKIEIK